MWDQPSCLKASLDVLLSEYGRPDLCVALEEVYLVNVVDALASQLLDPVTIRALEWREAAHIKWLKEVRGMGWHTESDDLVLCTVLVKLRCSVATIAI